VRVLDGPHRLTVKPATELEWTFEQAPEPGERPPGGLPQATPPGEPRRRGQRPAHILSGRRLVLLAGLAALIALGALAHTRIGWLRLEAQIVAEVAYEDARSLERQPALVRAVLSTEDPAWLELRAAEAALGLPATRPAAGLAPSGEPARLLSVTAAGRDVFVATVQRTWRDSAGESYAFSTQQRYRNLGPGLWERLPPAEAAGGSMAWRGLRLTADFPAADSAWMQAHLPRVDAALQAACAAWSRACPPGVQAHFVFASRLSQLPEPAALASADAQPGWEPVGRYPVAFDLAAALTPAPETMVLPSPHLAGLPIDAAASVALVRGLIVAGLFRLADGIVADDTARQADYFRDALVAREEIRQGLSAAPGNTAHPARYVPVEQLWSIKGPADSDLSSGLFHRLQVLHFAGFLAAERPELTVGDLLLRLRARPGLYAWLERHYGSGWRGLLGRYEQALAEDFEHQSALAWQHLDGLVYLCGSEVWRVQAGEPRRLSLSVPAEDIWIGLHTSGLAANGHMLAYQVTRRPRQAELMLVDLADGSHHSVDTASAVVPLGWAASAELVYLRLADNTREYPWHMQLMAYAPGSGQRRQLHEGKIMPALAEAGAWAPDGASLLLTVAGNAERTDVLAPALVSVSAGAEAPLRLLDDLGVQATFSPDGARVAYTRNWPGGSRSDRGVGLMVMNLDSRQRRVLLGPQGLQGIEAIFLIESLTWSPDGAWLVFQAWTGADSAGTSNGWYALPARGGPPRHIAFAPGNPGRVRAGFSADGQYLAFFEWGQGGRTSRAELLDWASDDRLRLAASFPAPAWSPDGHLLAVSAETSLYVLDPATGAYRWIRGGSCRAAAWQSESQ
jgi:hypothetical protein